MVIIHNLKQKTLAFTLANQKTLRLFPAESRPIEENLISTDLYRAEVEGIIRIEDGVVFPVEEAEAVSEEDPAEEEEPQSMPKPRRKKPRRLEVNE